MQQLSIGHTLPFCQDYIVAEVASASLKVAAHCLTEQGARKTAGGGLASIEHGFRMSDEALQIAKRNNVVLVGTDFTEQAAEYLGLPPAIAKQFHDIFIDRLKRAYKIGVTMAYGTDTFFLRLRRRIAMQLVMSLQHRQNMHFGVSGGNVNDISRAFCCSGTLGSLRHQPTTSSSRQRPLEHSIVADATKCKILLSIPACKGRAKLTPTLRVENWRLTAHCFGGC